MFFFFFLIALFVIFFVQDFYFINIAFVTAVSNNINVLLVFGFEYALLFVQTLKIFAKYILHIGDMHFDVITNNKETLLLHLNCVIGKIYLII